MTIPQSRINVKQFCIFVNAELCEKLCFQKASIFGSFSEVFDVGVAVGILI